MKNETAKEILQTIRYATVATVTPDGKPWNTPVASEIDDQYNIYWFSDKENQHSINLRNNPEAFIVVYDSTVPHGTGVGVYLNVTVEEMTDVTEINTIRNIKKSSVVNDAQHFLGDAVRRCYKATPKHAWMNDAEIIDGQFIRDYRVEINLWK